MITKLRVHCKECISATTVRLESGATELRCHKEGKAKNGFDTCEDGKHRNEEALRFDSEQVDFE